jgi:hypothetical protein
MGYSENDGNKQRDVTQDEQGTGMAEASMKLVWQDIGTLSAVLETFCGIMPHMTHD